MVVTVRHTMRELIQYIEGLTLVGGDGGPFRLLPWERRFITRTFSQDGDAALTVGRGNGKSALLGAAACAVLDPEGPLHGARREVVCCASSFSQGRVIFEGRRAHRHRRWRHQSALRRSLDRTDLALAIRLPIDAKARPNGSEKRDHGI